MATGNIEKMRTSQELYKYHVANVKCLTPALDRIALTVRSAIASSDHKTLNAFIPLDMLLLGAWAECRLRKLLFEPNTFDDADRSRVEQRPSHFEKWRKAVEIAFRKHYSIPKASRARVCANVIKNQTREGRQDRTRNSTLSIL